MSESIGTHSAIRALGATLSSAGVNSFVLLSSGELWTGTIYPEPILPESAERAEAYRLLSESASDVLTIPTPDGDDLRFRVNAPFTGERLVTLRNLNPIDPNHVGGPIGETVRDERNAQARAGALREIEADLVRV